MLFVQLSAAESPRETPHRTEPTDSPVRIRPLEDPADPLAMAAQTTTETRNHDKYTLGWVCALSKEQTAATAMLDQRHADLPKPPNDPNTYTLGSIGKHNIVIACLPEGEIGTHAAATIATWMISTFPLIKLGLMVGIGGGIPPKVRLGDVVVSTPAGQYPGVVQWDFGKAEEGGNFKQTGSLNNPPTYLRTALTKLKTENELNGSKIPKYLDDLKQKWPRLAPKYLRTESLEDVLFKADYGHVSENTTDCDVTPDSDDGEEEEESCKFCDRAKIMKRKIRDMRVHYGLIASGNRVIKDATFRNRLKKDLDGHVLCVEMEAAGLMNNFPCIVIRGICDYADSHKNKDWQEHAAAVAAAFAKELLEYVQPGDVSGERPVKEILSQVLDDTSAIRENTTHTRAKLDRKEDVEILDWLTPIDYGPQQSDYLSRRQAETGNCLLQSKEFLDWLAASKQTLFCPGMPGAGKTILTSIVVDFLYSKYGNDAEIGITYIYCNYHRQHEQRIGDLLPSMLKQLTQCRSSVPESVRGLYDQHKSKRTRPSVDQLLALLQSVVAMYSRVFIIIDALDECQSSDGCRTRFLSELFNLQTKYGANIFATSRHITEIVNCFKDSLSREIEIRASPDDVARYIEGHIGQLPSCVQQNRQLQEEIATGISESVNGMFLLAQLYLGLLADKLTLNEIRSAIETFRNQGQGLGEDQKDQVLARAYEQTMERISGQMPGMKTLAIKVLSWITCTKRQLSTSELQHALAIKTGKLELDPGDLTPIGDMVSVCAGLVTIDEESGIIRLVHHTAQQYFERSQGPWFLHARAENATNPNPVCTGLVTVEELDQTVRLIHDITREYLHRVQGSWSREANAMIATSCLTYLLFPAFNVDLFDLDAYIQGGKSNEQPYPLLSYCMEYGALHASLVTPEPPCVTRFFSSESNIAKNWLLSAAKNGGSQAESTAEWLLERGACIDINDSEWKTPLHHAVLNGWKRCVQLLLQREASLDQDSDNMTPFHYAVSNNNREVAQIFLDGGIPVDLTVRRRIIVGMFQNGRVTYRVQDSAQNPAPNGSAEKGLTSLHLATLMGCQNMTKFLLEQGANPNYASDHGQTPLHLALGQNLYGPHCLGNRDVWSDPDARIECVLDHAEDEEYLSTWIWVDKVRLDIVNLLLKQPRIDVNAQDISGVSPLHVVSGDRRASKFMIQRLIEKGARVSIRTNKGETPLHLACQAENIDALGVLLTSGADPTECDENGANTLHYAARCKEMIRIIFDRVSEETQGALIDSKDKHGRNALHHLWKGFELTEIDSLRLLLELSTGVNELDQEGLSPTATFLSTSVLLNSDDDPEALRLLFRHGADPSLKTKQGLNLAHLAARSGRASAALLRILASQKVDMRARDEQRRTALHHGAISGWLTKEALCCLRDEFQLSTELLDVQGKTALAYAVEKGQDEHHPDMFEPDRWARVEKLLRE
ncbi:hypothetical protein FLAG1_09784 [Fusarium langsethiae]|uniref:Uncharacterized protein n=1 Tax=Fusarium langsethiae TaxID=179993 RepID=A0A0M9EPS1_FUSLA|nr:hypothetical protein FLAG1_09784 [Fusarium langsethiae]GKU08442.1 unnamed protein product [Fusarium langsethiae]